MMYDTPAITRRYRTKAVIDAEAFFDIGTILDILDPPIEDYEMEYVHRAAVSTFAYDGHRGRQSPFPSPADFIDDLWGLDADSPAMAGKDGRRNILLLRLAYKVKSGIKLDIEEGDSARLYILDCPVCQHHTTHVNVGPPPFWHTEGELWLPRMLTVRFYCDCRDFKLIDYDIVEEAALKRAASDFALL